MWHKDSYYPHFPVQETEAEGVTCSQATQLENGRIQAQLDQR